MKKLFILLTFFVLTISVKAQFARPAGIVTIPTPTFWRIPSNNSIAISQGSVQLYNILYGKAHIDSLLLAKLDTTKATYVMRAAWTAKEPGISKSTGFLKWSGSAWAWDTSTYANVYLPNDTWVYGYDYAGNLVPLYKLSKDNLLTFAPKVGLGSLYSVADAGKQSIINMPLITSSDTLEYSIGFGGKKTFKFQAIGNGSGGYTGGKFIVDGTFVKVGGLSSQYMMADGSTSTGTGAATMIYPGAGIAVSTGTGWGTSVTNNAANWNTAYGWGDWHHTTLSGYGITDTPWTGLGYITSSALNLPNDTWSRVYDYAGNLSNFFKLTPDNVIVPAFTFGINSLFFVRNSGINRVGDLVVDANATTGDYHGFQWNIGGVQALKIAGKWTGSAMDTIIVTAPVYAMTTGAAAGKIAMSEDSRGKIQWSAPNITGNAGTVTVAANTTNADYYPIFVTSATGSLAPQTTAAKLTFNPSTGVLVADNFKLSDRRLKTNIRSISQSDFIKISKVDFYKYWMKGDSTQKDHFGPMAQEIEKAGLKQFVNTDNNDKKSVNYAELLILKIAQMDDYIKLLDEVIKDQEKRIDKLERKNKRRSKQ